MKTTVGRLLLVLFSLSGITSCYSQECDYRYTRQPPTELNCNPYDVNYRLALTCSVEGPNTPEFSIIWFRRTNSGVEEMTGSQQRVVIAVGTSSVAGGAAQFTRRSSRFALTELEEVNDFGEYWCQVRLVNNGTVFEEKSNILNLGNEAQYQGLRRCMGSNVVDQIDCLHVLQIDNAPTDSGAVVQPTSSSDLSPTPSNVASAGVTEEPEDSRKNLAALYAVIAVIAVFCIVIVTLTIIIVVLYRKKCGPVRFKTEDHKQTPNPYSGFTRERVNSNHSNIVSKSERSDSRLTNSSQHQQQSFGSPPPPFNGAAEEEPYSRLMRDHPTQIPGGVVEVLPGYSKLEIQDTVPPLPPKPPSTKSKSRTPPPHSPLVHSPPERQSAIYSDLTDNDIERGIKSNHLLPHVNIYNTLDSNAEAPLSPDGHEYQELTPEREKYDYSEEFTEWRISHMTETSKMSTQKSLFDDPEYSPLKGVCNKKDIAIVDPRYVGDYERSPTYACPTVKMKANEVDPKYRGDYERDPMYVPKWSPRRASCSSVGAHRIPKPEKVLKRRKSLEADALHKYTGDYEWSPNYVPAPLRNGSNGPLPALDRKYSGNYERDPVYVAHVLKRSAHGRHRAQSVEYTIPDTQSREDATVPPHIPHEYAQLEDDLKDPPREYARLNSQTPELIT